MRSLAKVALLAPILTATRDGAFLNWAEGLLYPADRGHFVYALSPKAAMVAQGFGVALLPRVIGGGTSRPTLPNRLERRLETQV